MDRERWNALYGRQSLDKKDSISIEMQLEKGRSLYPEETCFHTYIDRGYSGKNTNRPAFREMMKDVERGRIKRVIVYRIDRFSRSLLDFCDTWERLNKKQVEFISVNERFDTSAPMGKAMLFILMVFAQLERETIAERVKDNYYSRAGQGRWPGGPAPAGYECAGGTLPYPTLRAGKDADAVAEAFARYGQMPCCTLQEIGRMLRERGVLGGWSNTALARMLRNPVYVKADEAIYGYFAKKGTDIVCGKEAFDGRHGALLIGKQKNDKSVREGMQLSIGSWEGLVESHQWLACQEKLEQNRKKGKSGRGRHSWLTGLLRCGYCGRAMLVCARKKRQGEMVRYFTCSYRYKGCEHAGKYPSIGEVEAEMGRRIENLFSGCARPDEGKRSEKERWQNEASAAQEGIANLVEQVKRGASELTMEYLNRELERLEQKKQEASNALWMLQADATETFAGLPVERLSWEEKKAAAWKTIEKIQVYEEKIEIFWRL